MADVIVGRKTAYKYTAWGLLNLLAAGPGLALLAAYDAASDGHISLQYPIFGTHAWVVMMGWCVPVTMALVFWLLPILKDLPIRSSALYDVCLALLIVPTLGLGAYLFMAHTGRPALFILPPAWACYLTAGILYTLTVWKASARTLRPTASDVGFLAGSVWLLVVLAVRVITALGAMATGRHDFLASSEPAVLIAMMFGFLGNTGLALASAIGPEFLMTPHSRPTISTSFRIYNTAVALWCAGAAWVLPFPFGLGRLLLAITGFLFAYGTVRLLIELRLLDLLLLRANSRRRRLTRTALGTAGVLLVVAVTIIALIGLWVSGTMTWAPQELTVLPMHLVVVGFFSCVVIGLLVPLLGNRSLSGAKLPLAYGAYIFIIMWLLAKTALSVIGIVTDQPLWYYRYFTGGLISVGAVLLTLWILFAMIGNGRPAARPPDTASPPPADR